MIGARWTLLNYGLALASIGFLAAIALGYL